MERHDITQSAKLECVPVESDWAQLCEELEKRSIMIAGEGFQTTIDPLEYIKEREGSTQQ
ncbi:hypothetical protein McaMca56_003482 [Microsporum canis]